MKKNKIKYVLFLLLITVSFVSIGKIKVKIEFKSSRDYIYAGEEVVLSWEVENATKVALLNVKDSLPYIGNIKLFPLVNTTYQLAVSDSNGRVFKRSLTINVDNRTLYLDYLNYPSKVTDTGTVILSWRVFNCKYVNFVGLKDSLPASGEIKLYPKEDINYEFIAYGADKSTLKKSIEIKVEKKDLIIKPKFLLKGEKAVLKWRFINASNVKLMNNNKIYNALDSLEVKPKETEVYKFVVNRIKAKADTMSTVLRVVFAKIKYFSGKNVAKSGDQVILKWEVEGYNKVEIEGIKKGLPAKGTIIVTPEKTTTYKLILDNGKLRLSAIHTVIVLDRNAVMAVKDVNGLPYGQVLNYEINGIDWSAYPAEVKMQVVVVDSSGNFVSKLVEIANNKFFQGLIETVANKEYNIKDFTVREVYELNASVTDFSLTLDYSGSMSDAIDKLEDAAKIFITNKRKSDKLGIIKFDGRIGIESFLINDNEAIIKNFKFDGLKRYGGSTALYAASDEGLEMLKNSANKRCLILFTDGLENTSYIHRGRRLTSADEIVRKARANKTKINIIAYGEGVNSYVLKNIAKFTGGKFYSLKRPEDILNIFNELGFTLKNYYEISFKPQVAEGNHKVDLICNNMKNKDVKVSGEFFIGENFTIDEFDNSDLPYWKDSIYCLKGLKPVRAPQTIALFDFDEYKIKTNDKKNIIIFADYMKRNPKAIAYIFGHSDSYGYNKYCLGLSSRRAEEVKKLLVKEGIEKSRVYTKGFGKQHLLWDPDNDEWQAQENRRAEIMLLE